MVVTSTFEELVMLLATTTRVVQGIAGRFCQAPSANTSSGIKEGPIVTSPQAYTPGLALDAKPSSKALNTKP